MRYFQSREAHWLVGAGLGLLSMVLVQPAAADGAQLVQQECSQCHAVSAPEELTAERIRTRLAPDLFYAGNKFRPEWLEAWLQAPERIRPAGTFFGQNVVAGEDRDIVPLQNLQDHPLYSAEQASAATEYLMTLRPHDDLVDAVTFEPGSISGMLGKMNFNKFKGCNACHETAPGVGGLSGPEMHTVFARATPAFLFSYIANPQAWAPKTFMPNAHLNDEEVAKLVNYLKLLSED